MVHLSSAVILYSTMIADDAFRIFIWLIRLMTDLVEADSHEVICLVLWLNYVSGWAQANVHLVKLVYDVSLHVFISQAAC